MTPAWLTVRRGSAPLVVSLPHAGLDLPSDVATGLVSSWLARKDADWFIDALYGFAPELDATVVHTAISRSAIDVNRDPSGASLYPGQATTGLCPLTTFDGEPLYLRGGEPDEAEIGRRRTTYFEPYHAALRAEVRRLRATHDRVVVFDAHSIRSTVPRLFAGTLPECSIGTVDGTSCDPALTAAVEAICDAAGRSRIVNGRFKGGYITRSFGRPAEGVHAIQMELACRTYLPEPLGPVEPDRWPPRFDPAFAALMAATLRDILGVALAFAAGHPFPVNRPGAAP